MNYQEIEICVSKAKAGSAEDLVKLLHQYKPFIIKTARRFNLRGYSHHDMLQIGYTGIMNAVSKYELGSCTFSSYVYTTIKNCFNQIVRDILSRPDELSLNSPVRQEGEYPSEYIHCISSEENLEEDIVNSLQIKDLRKALAKLPEDERDLINMVYYKGISVRAYASLRNMNYLNVLRKKDNILMKLRWRLEI